MSEYETILNALETYFSAIQNMKVGWARTTHCGFIFSISRCVENSKSHMPLIEDLIQCLVKSIEECLKKNPGTLYILNDLQSCKDSICYELKSGLVVRVGSSYNSKENTITFKADTMFDIVKETP